MQVIRYGYIIERLGGRYRLAGSLGSGAMADVYLAWDERVGRKVAIKIMKADDLDQQTLNRFLKEASQVVGWNHPHILRVYEDAKLELLDAENGSVVPYIVMEYVTGGDLQKRLKPGQSYPLAETLSIFAQLCNAVQYAHGRNIIHRDLKPHNILFRRLMNGSEQVVLGDFGLAVRVDATHHTFAQGGTLAYMAPEQFRGQATRASDIFSLGVILYQLCTGNLPFRHSLEDFQRGGLFEMPERPSVLNSSLPKVLDDAILKAIAEDPAKRFETASLFWRHVRMAMMPPPALVAKSDVPSIGMPPVSAIRSPASPTAGLGGLPANRPTRQQNNDKIAAIDAVSFGPTQRRSRRRLLSFTLIVFTLLVIGGTVLLLSSGLSSRISVGASEAAVTINPANTMVTGTYSIDAVPGGTTGKSQVAARILTSTKSQSGTVNATGVGHTTATYATGSLTFYNALTVSQTVGSGTVLTGADGVQVMNTQPAVIPAAQRPTEGFVTVAARAVAPGANGNISPLDINGACCLSGVDVQNPNAFTGGQNAQTSTVVSQNDINSFATPLETSLTMAAKADVMNQKRANEQLVGSVTCSSPLVTSSPPVGQATKQATVTVSVMCSAEVYDQQAAFALAQDSLMAKAGQSPGPGYALVGAILTTVKQASVVDSKGTVAMLIFAEGRWVYQFSDAQKKNLANLIKGKSKSDAQAFLLQQPGVSKVSIEIAGGGTTLPTDPTQISIVVQPVQGFPGTPTPTAGLNTPTSTATSAASPTPIASPTAA